MVHISNHQNALLQMYAHQALRRHINDALQAYDLNPRQWAILGILQENQAGVRAATLATELNVKNPLITMLVDPLTKRGWITKAADTEDGRAKLLQLSAEGQKHIKKVDADVAARLDQLLSGVRRSEFDIYQKVMQIILYNADQLQDL